MPSLEARYLVDAKGERVAVVLDIAIYQQLLEAAEELEAIREYDAAKAANDEVIPFQKRVLL